MKKIQTIKSAMKLAVAASAMALCSMASAAYVTLSDHAASSPPNATSIGVRVFDVAPGKAVGAYDISIRYDASIWSAGSVNFGSYLSGPDPMGSFTSFDTSTPGLVQIFEVSFITPLDPQPLDVLQPDAFTIATIDFSAIGQGTGNFSIESVALFDEFGDTMAANVVPEPGTLALALLALGSIGLAGKRSRNRDSLQPVA